METNNLEGGQSNGTPSALSQALIFYAVVSVIAAFIHAYTYDGIVSQRVVIQVTFWVRAGMFITGSIGGTIGMAIGRIVRDWVRPDFIVTGDGMKGLVKARLFWAIGPQLIGMLVGLFLLSSTFITLVK